MEAAYKNEEMLQMQVDVWQLNIFTSSNLEVLSNKDKFIACRLHEYKRFLVYL